MKKTLVLIAAALLSTTANSQTNVPNTFESGQPARADDVNANFDALESGVNQNASGIVTNTNNIDENVSNIGDLGSDIDTNSQNIQEVSNAVTTLANPQSFEFVGFSSASVSGNAGLFAKAAACQADFGSNARMASSREIVESTIQPTLNAAAAWVRLIIVAAVRRDSGNSRVWDYSGFTPNTAESTLFGDVSCNSGEQGLSLSQAGVFILTDCNSSLSVACSALQ